MTWKNRNENNSTNYDHPKESNLWDIHKALEYDPGGQPTLRTSMFNLAVARGEVPGVTGLSIAGYNPAVGTTFVPCWEDGNYVYFNTAQQVRIWSESTADTDVTVLVNGLDSNYNIISETIHLTNSTTGVLSSLLFLRINSISITKLPMNVGRIHAGSSDKAISLAYITVDAGRSQMTVYTVPAGYTFYLTQSNFYTNQTGSQTALYRSYTKTPTGITNTILTFPFVTQYRSDKVVPRPYPERTDIQWQVASSTGTSRIGGQIEGYLIRNPI